MALLGFRNCLIIRYPLVLLGGFLAISIITALSYSWPTTRNTLSPYFSEPPNPPEHSEVEEVRQVRIAIEEAGGSLSFYLLEQPDAAL